MEESFLNININRLRGLFSGSKEMGLGDDFFLSEVRYDESMKVLKYPFRFDGYLAIFCMEGHMKVDINLNTFEIRPSTLLINVPGNILRVSEVDEDNLNQYHFIVVAMSQEFMSSIRFDFNKLFNESMSLLDNPCIVPDKAQIAIATKYFELSNDILKTDVPDKKEAVGSLISSLFYVMGGIWSKNITEAKHRTISGSSARVKLIFDQFIHLVTEYHTSERNMAFYADKLCLTPKYLSKLIKSVSGRSAPDWIDSFVILEAKTMLKYSDVNIKNIVYRLHFPNQSVFYKFFKAHTGMTPSEYRNS